MTGYAIPDIPRLYTALAEWVSCMAMVLLLVPKPPLKKLIPISLAYLVLLVLFMELTAHVVLWLWPLCMLAAFLSMTLFIFLCARITYYRSIYYGVLAFSAAEFMASLAWQIIHYGYMDSGRMNNWIEALVLLLVYGGVILLEYRLFARHGAISRQWNISRGDWFTALFIALIVFACSNLKFITDGAVPAPPYSREIASARTLMDVAGVAMLYAHYVSCCSNAMERELELVQQALQAQYQQYMQARESIDAIHMKYHDMKHQIQYLRSEPDPQKRNAFLDRIEDEIQRFELQNKTGHPVLDTILTGKSMFCHKHGITMTTVADGKLLEFMEVMDICNIFGNALDNAIESVLAIDDPEKRLIHVTVSQVNAFVMIRIENYYEGPLQTDGADYLSTKQDRKNHGYGIKSIKYTAERYDGAVYIQTGNNWFDLKVLIPTQTKSGNG